MSLQKAMQKKITSGKKVDSGVPDIDKLFKAFKQMTNAYLAYAVKKQSKPKSRPKPKPKSRLKPESELEESFAQSPYFYVPRTFATNA